MEPAYIETSAWLTPLALAAAVASAALTGVLFEPGPWYRTLRKPAWTPPDWLFPIAWTALYAAMLTAAWLVTRSGAPLAFAGLALWAWQLVLNAAWSPVFFGLHRMGTGFALIVAMLAAAVATTWAFFQCSQAAGLLMLPYLVWIAYAAALNLAIWISNPAVRTR